MCSSNQEEEHGRPVYRRAVGWNPSRSGQAPFPSMETMAKQAIMITFDACHLLSSPVRCSHGIFVPLAGSYSDARLRTESYQQTQQIDTVELQSRAASFRIRCNPLRTTHSDASGGSKRNAPSDPRTNSLKAALECLSTPWRSWRQRLSSRSWAVILPDRRLPMSDPRTSFPSHRLGVGRSIVTNSCSQPHHLCTACGRHRPPGEGLVASCNVRNKRQPKIRMVFAVLIRLSQYGVVQHTPCPFYVFSFSF